LGIHPFGRSFFYGKIEQSFKAVIIFLRVFFIKVDVLTDKPIREAGGDADLVNREVLHIKEDDFTEILDIAFNSSFGVMSSFLYLRELITGEVELKYLGFMSSTSAHIMSPAT